MMLSGVRDHLFISLSIKKYLMKLRSYSNYFCGLILAQVLAATMLLSGSSTMGMGIANLNITLHTYSAQITLIFSVVWALIIAILITSRVNKDASFSFPGNRLTDCLSDVAYIVTGCLFGGIATALFGAALRMEIFLAHSGSVLAHGFYPVFTDLCTIAAATSLYMLLISAAGYFAGTLFRISKVFIIIVSAILIFAFFIVSNYVDTTPFWNIIVKLLFEESSLALFAISVVFISAVLYGLSVVIANHMEVRK